MDARVLRAALGGVRCASDPAWACSRFGRADGVSPTVIFIQQPGTPLVERGVDGSVAQFFAVAGQAEDVGGEEFGDVALVIVVDLFGAVEPTDGLADGGFGFDDDERQAVDEQDQVGAALGRAGAEGVLGGDDVLVLIQVLVIDQVDGDVLVVLAKGHGALAAQPGGEFFVGADQAVGAHGEHDGAQFVEHFVGAGGLGGDLGVEADERIAQIVFDEHVVDAAGQRQGGDVMPARAFGVAPERDVGGLGFTHATF